MSSLSSGYVVLDNHKGLKGVFSTLGAGVRSLSLEGKPLLLTPEKEEDYLGSPQFFGKTLGRFAGRHAAEGILNGKAYHLEEEAPGICLHGGNLHGFSFRPFASEVGEDEDSYFVTFRRLSPDLECGFPGNLNVSVTYRMSKDLNILSIHYQATSEEDTLINLTNHMYWNIGNNGDVNDYHLLINASEVGVFKEGTLLLNGTVQVPESLDFRNNPLLKDKLDLLESNAASNGTIDHTFLFDKITTIDPQIILDTPDLTISCYTDYEAANIYVDSTLTPLSFQNNSAFTTMKRRGIAIEPECFPTRPSTLLKKGVEYNHLITYTFTKK